MAKKKFNQTKIGKFLTSPLVKGVIKSVPFGVGSLAANVLDEVKGGNDVAGAVNWQTVTPQIIKLAFYIGVAIAFAKGMLTFDEAEQVKDLINP